ncbi:MAG: hypothetical protein R2824_15525 [Saprospiraceae bacterium]
MKKLIKKRLTGFDIIKDQIVNKESLKNLKGGIVVEEDILL